MPPLLRTCWRAEVRGRGWEPLNPDLLDWYETAGNADLVLGVSNDLDGELGAVRHVHRSYPDSTYNRRFILASYESKWVLSQHPEGDTRRVVGSFAEGYAWVEEARLLAIAERAMKTLLALAQ
jgi:hypothetical protein